MAMRRQSHDTGRTEQIDKSWLDRQYHKDGTIKRPDELEKLMKDPPQDIDPYVLDRIHGSMIGMALGDALGASVEFRPRQFLVDNPVTTLKGGGTWGLEKGQFTDDTSMALCLANSLIARRDYVPYDQLVRYKWWHQEGYMSSTGQCFDIGAATRQSLVEFERRQKEFSKKYNIPFEQIDSLPDPEILDKFDANCSKEGVAGNGALMRLAPVPLFFYLHPIFAVKCSGHSGEITHGDEKAYDACRYYGALIVAAVNGASKDELLDKDFYSNHEKWFDGKRLHPDIMNIAEGSYQKKGGYDKGIRGKGYIVNALEAALWAFWSDEDSFEKGALAAVNLGDDTDTTAAIYGQLAGAHYGFRSLPEKWTKQVYANKFIECLSKWIAYEGKLWALKEPTTPNISSVTGRPVYGAGNVSSYEEETNFNSQSQLTEKQKHGPQSSKKYPDAQVESTSVSEPCVDPKSNFRPRRNTLHPEDPLSQRNSHGQSVPVRSQSAKRHESTTESDCIYFPTNIKTCDDVCRWISSLNKEYAAYVKIFRKYDIDGYWLLNQVDNEKLNKYGIQRSDHRQDIIENIEELKKRCPKEFPITPK